MTKISESEILHVAHLARLDLTLVGIAIASAIVTTVVAGLYPAWRVCRVPPGAYLRLQ